MIRTAIACLLLALAGYAGAAWLTHDFQVWTAEGARRLEVALDPVPLPPVGIEGVAGVQRSLAALLADGRHVTIVDFFYTRCETVCLSLGSTFQQLQAALSSDPSPVQLLSLSLDPRDSVAELRAYAARMQADERRWTFMRGADATRTQQLLAAFRVTAVPVGQGDFEHNAALLVADQHGRLVRVFDIAEQQLALDYARHLAADSR
jgi:protein SCO1